MKEKTGGKIMKDGERAWLTESSNYFARRHPAYEKYNSIHYYKLDRSRIFLAKGTCPSCKQTIKSKMCGDYVSCKCGKSFVDTDRWMPERQRFGGLLAGLLTT